MTVHPDIKPSPLKTTTTIVGSLLGVGAILIIIAIMLYVGRSTEPTIPGVKSSSERMALLNELRAHDQQMLSSYGWVDQSHGIVRIPIDLAMEKLIRQHTIPQTNGQVNP